MKREYRIKKGYEFKRALRKGKWKQAKDITIYVINNRVNFNKMGICVTKKNGNSVQRNKLKRWARECYNKIRKENNIKRSYDIIIMFKKETTVTCTNYSKIYNQIEEIFKYLDLISN